MSETEIPWASIITGAVSAVTTWFFTREKEEVAIESQEIDNQGKELGNVDQAVAIWRGLAKDLEERFKEMQGEMYALRKENGELIAENRELRLKNKQLIRELEELKARIEKMENEQERH